MRVIAKGQQTILTLKYRSFVIAADISWVGNTYPQNMFVHPDHGGAVLQVLEVGAGKYFPWTLGRTGRA